MSRTQPTKHVYHLSERFFISYCLFYPIQLFFLTKRQWRKGGPTMDCLGRQLFRSRSRRKDDYARRLAMLAVSSDSNLTVVGSRSVTSVPDPIVTEEDLGLWSSNLGKFPKPGKNFFSIVTKSIVSVPIVRTAKAAEQPEAQLRPLVDASLSYL